MKNTLVLLMLISLAGCAYIPTAIKEASDAQDGARDAAKFALCRGISVGSWIREYGRDVAKADAWKTLCGAPVTAVPAP